MNSHDETSKNTKIIKLISPIAQGRPTF